MSANGMRRLKATSERSGFLRSRTPLDWPGSSIRWDHCRDRRAPRRRRRNECSANARFEGCDCHDHALSAQADPTAPVAFATAEPDSSRPVLAPAAMNRVHGALETDQPDPLGDGTWYRGASHSRNDNEGHVGRPFPQRELMQMLLLTEMPAMIGPENHNRVVSRIGLLQCIE